MNPSPPFHFLAAARRLVQRHRLALAASGLLLTAGLALVFGRWHQPTRVRDASRPVAPPAGRPEPFSSGSLVSHGPLPDQSPRRSVHSPLPFPSTQTNPPPPDPAAPFPPAATAPRQAPAEFAFHESREQALQTGRDEDWNYANWQLALWLKDAPDDALPWLWAQPDLAPWAQSLITFADELAQSGDPWRARLELEQVPDSQLREELLAQLYAQALARGQLAWDEIGNLGLPANMEEQILRSGRSD